jgi:hypothetical protein
VNYRTADPELYIDRFFRTVRLEIAANAHKGEWTQLSLDQAEAELKPHLKKLRQAVNTKDVNAIREHTADLVAILLFISKSSGCLDDEPEPLPNPKVYGDPLDDGY